MKLSYKAQKILKEDGIAKIENDLYQVKSGTNKDKSYFVSRTQTATLGWTCECIANKNFRKKCVHIELVNFKDKGNTFTNIEENLGEFL